MRNEAIRGWRVRNRFDCGCHVFDVAGDYRSVTIPAEATGALTGDVFIFPEGVDEESCREFAQSAVRIKAALKRVILPNSEETLRMGRNYWEQTKALRDEDLLASRVAFAVRWDNIYEQEPETLKCASYVPWLELVEGERQ